MTEKFLMARNFFQIFTENNPVMGYSKTFFIPEAKGLKTMFLLSLTSVRMDAFFDILTNVFQVHYEKVKKFI